VQLPELALPGLRIRYAAECIQIPLAEFMHRFLGSDAVGILGFDFLSRVVTKIDYAKRTVSFYDPQRFEYSGDGMVQELEITSQQAHLPVMIEGEPTGRWMLDTGASGSMFSHWFARENGFLDQDTHTYVGAGAGGRMEIAFRRFGSATLAGLEIAEPLLFYPKQGGGVLADRSCTGLVGYSLLRGFVVYLDLPGRRLILEKGDDFGSAFVFDKSGIQLAYGEDDELVLLHVASDTPAHESGFAAGDIILQVNGEPPPREIGLIRMRERLNGESGTKLHITVLRGDEEITLPLVLRAYV
jgi:hypothetical protein